jgi:shikimate dehydrogenase
VPAIRLGLIGDNIAASRAPALHRAAGRLTGLDVTYDLLVLKALGLGFDAVFDRARDEGYRGLNITYPYKERVVRRLTIDDASVRAIAACNTVIFEETGPMGANTDHTGFIGAWCAAFGHATPGAVAMAGAGGVGRAIAFGLAKLGARALALFDTERARAEALSHALAAYCPALDVRVTPSIEASCEAADGLVNATPAGMAGMAGTGGSAFPASLVRGRRWAFDAVYTPVQTPFVQAARSAGLAVITGYELFFWQGLDAFRIFAKRDVDPEALRGAIERQPA